MGVISLVLAGGALILPTAANADSSSLPEVLIKQALTKQYGTLFVNVDNPNISVKENQVTDSKGGFSLGLPITNNSVKRSTSPARKRVA